MSKVKSKKEGARKKIQEEGKNNLQFWCNDDDYDKDDDDADVG